MLSLLGCVLLAEEIGFFYSSAADLLGEWSRPEYSHCPLLFLFALGWAGYLYWHKGPPRLQSRPGILIVLGSLLMNVFGSLSANNWISEFSVILNIGGLCLAIFGSRAFTIMLPGLFLLVFTVPLPPILLATLTAKMQLISSSLSVQGLNLLGIPVFQEGNIIDLGSYKLQVAEACSGLRYLFPFMSFGYLFCMLFEKNWIKRSVLVVSTIPITIFMNAFRIIFVGITVDFWGQKMAEGVLHDFEGWLVFVACIACLMVENWALSLLPFPLIQKSKLASSDQPVVSTRVTTSLVMLTLILFFGLVAEHLAGMNDQEASVPRTPFAFFPLSIDDWSGQSETLPNDQIAILKFSDYFMANYYRKDLSSPVNFYAAYYASQRRNAAPHSPLVCIGGSGWQISSLDANYEVQDADGNRLATVNRAVVTNGATTELVYFWFQERGRDLTTASSRKWFLFKDAIMKGRTDGALVRVTTPIPTGSNEQAGDRELAIFLHDVLPLTSRFLPN